jgi:signal transduction histidine kinase
MEEVAGIILHELGPVVGTIRMHSSREIPDFHASKTNEAIERLRALLDAIRRLKKAASVPELLEFDLSSLVNSVVRDEAGSGAVEIKLAGPRPFAVRADQDTLYIAIANGLRNAVEASLSPDAVRLPEISITWGRAGGECFLGILDSGNGLPENASLIANIGTTNKVGHFGFGLATAQQVMDCLSGSMLLSNRPGGGAMFELRWSGFENLDN